MMIYFKRFFGDITGESVTFFNLILLQVRQRGLLHLELPIFRSWGHNLDLTK